MNLLLLLSVLSFQDPIQERQEVGYVLLDIVVSDISGNPVTGLQASDFTITDGRKKIKPDFFQILDYRQDFEKPADERQAAISAPTPPQQIALVLDFQLFQYENLVHAFNEVEKLLNELDPASNYEVFIYAMDRGALTDGFEGNLETVRLALKDYRGKFQSYGQKDRKWDRDNPTAGSIPTRQPRSRVTGIGVHNRNGNRKVRGNRAVPYEIHHAHYFESLLKLCLQRNRAYDSPCDCIDSTLEDFLFQLKQRTEFMMETLIAITDRFQEVNAPKTMFLASPGYIVENVTAIHDLADDYRVRASCGAPVLTKRTGVTSLDRNRDKPLRARKLELERDFNEVIDACVRNRVIFNTIYFYNDANYPGGFTGTFREEFLNGHYTGLRTLSEGSGGTINRGFDIDTAIQQGLARNRYFYVLGYHSPKGRKGKFRKLKIGVNRKGVKLRHREGYYKR